MGRAADYVFSGNAIDTDSESESETQVSDTNNRNENEKSINGKQASSSSSSLSSLSAEGVIRLGDDNSNSNNNDDDDDNNNYTEDVPSFKDAEPKHLIKDFDRKAESSTTISYDPAIWSVVPAVC